jgi:heterodisulfide reductase subunit A-like polyferredoxin
MKHDTIVIGAGVSGLTTAILLAQDGRKVALLEKSRAIAPTIIMQECLGPMNLLQDFARDWEYYLTSRLEVTKILLVIGFTVLILSLSLISSWNYRVLCSSLLRVFLMKKKR